MIIHRSKILPEELTVIGGVPTTTLPRTIFDLACAGRPVRRLIKDAEFRRMLEVDDLVAVLERHPTRPGRQALAEIVTPLVEDTRPTRSDLEDRFLAFCRRRRLPMPETNVRLRIDGRRYEPDCLWPDERVIVELDGRDAHTRKLAFHEDRARDRSLIAAGWVPMRITSEQLDHDSDGIDVDIRRTLALRAGARGRDHTGGG